MAKDGDHDPEGWSTKTVLFLALVGGSLAIALLLEFFGWISTHELWPWDDKKPISPDVPRNATAAGAALAVLLAGAVAYTRQRTDEANHRLERRRDERAQISDLRDRYTAAAEQLGHKSAAVRLAGTYAFEKLSDDWHLREAIGEAQTCIDVLCAYMRTPTAANNDDNEVRLTILRIFAKHLDRNAAISWSRRHFDLTGAHMPSGHVAFLHPDFNEGCWVRFDGAHFNEGNRVGFVRPRYNNGCRVRFEGAHFNEGCWVGFEDANFNEGSGVIFLPPRFITVSEVRFDHAHFNNGCWVGFLRPYFSQGCEVRFEGAHFEDGVVVVGPWPGMVPPGVWPPDS